ncbi:hypothetical protein Tco_0104037 [Tanacetum coccineum]
MISTTISRLLNKRLKNWKLPSLRSSSQNKDFVPILSCTNEVNTAYEVNTATIQVSPARTQVSTPSTQVSTANLSDVTVYAFWPINQMRECRGLRNQDRRNWNQDSSRRTVNVEETSSKAMLAIDGAVPPPPTRLFSLSDLDLSNSGLEEFQQPEFEGYGPKISKSVSKDISNEVRKSLDAPLVEELVSDVDKFEKKTVFSY